MPAAGAASTSCRRRRRRSRPSASCPEADALAAANKRIVNILRKSGERSGASRSIARRLADGAEHDLYLAFQKLEPVVDERCAAGDYTGALMALATARPASTASSTT